MHPEIQALQTEVEHTKGIVSSAVVLINGIGGRIQAAVDAALAGGATAEQLQPLSTLRAELQASTDSLAEAVNAND